MRHLSVPSEISVETVRKKNSSWSAGVYQEVVIPTRNVRPVRDLLSEWHNGEEVGSASYMSTSNFYFMRTKCLQSHSFLTQSKGDSIVSINPKAFRAVVGKKPDMRVQEGDILYARGGNVGEVAFATQCGEAIMSSHILKLRFAQHQDYCFAFLKNDICKLQQQSNVAGSISALDNFKIDTLLDCKIPFPCQPSAEQVIEYVSVLVRAIVDKELAIRARNEEILNIIESELMRNQKSEEFQFDYPSIREVRCLKRTDAGIYDQEYKSKIWLVQNYSQGWKTPSASGFVIIPGPSLEIKLLKTRIDSDSPKPGFYMLLIPANISEYGTMNVVSWLGTGKKLPLLQRGDILFGEAGFHKGRSIVLIDNFDRVTTNAHGLYARRSDGNLDESIFFAVFLIGTDQNGLLI